VSEALGIPIVHEEVSTIGGLVYTVLGRVPEVGERIELQGFRVSVEQVVRRSIRRLRFERLP
jgi:CBS domain containing-hemolysin-like protein